MVDARRSARPAALARPPALHSTPVRAAAAAAEAALLAAALGGGRLALCLRGGPPPPPPSEEARRGEGAEAQKSPGRATHTRARPAAAAAAAGWLAGVARPSPQRRRKAGARAQPSPAQPSDGVEGMQRLRSLARLLLLPAAAAAASSLAAAAAAFSGAPPWLPPPPPRRASPRSPCAWSATGPLRPRRSHSPPAGRRAPPRALQLELRSRCRKAQAGALLPAAAAAAASVTLARDPPGRSWPLGGALEHAPPREGPRAPAQASAPRLAARLQGPRTRQATGPRSGAEPALPSKAGMGRAGAASALRAL